MDSDHWEHLSHQCEPMAVFRHLTLVEKLGEKTGAKREKVLLTCCYSLKRYSSTPPLIGMEHPKPSNNQQTG